MGASRLARNFGTLTTATTVARGVRLMYVVALARLLPPEEVGIYVYCTAFYLGLFVLSSFAQRTFLAWRLPARAAARERIRSHSLTLTLLTTVLSVLAGFVYVWSRQPDSLLAYAVLAFLFALTGRTIAYWVRGCFMALEDVSWIPRYELTFRGVEIAVGTALLTGGAGLLAICWLHALVWGLEAVFSVRRLTRCTGRRLSLGRRRVWLLRAGSVSLVLMLSGGLFAVVRQCGVVMLELLQPDTVLVAQLGIAMQFFGSLLIAPVALVSVLLPAVGRVRRLGGETELGAIETVLKTGVVAGALVAIACHAYAPWLIGALFGQNFTDAGVTLGWVSWAFGPYAATMVAGHVLGILERRRQAAAVAGAMLLVNILVLPALLALGALQAACAALLISSVFGFAVSASLLQARLAIPGPAWWVKPLCLLSALGGLMTAEVVPNTWVAPLLAVGWLAAVHWTRVFSRTEVDFVLKRIGFPARDPAATKGRA